MNEEAIQETVLEFVKKNQKNIIRQIRIGYPNFVTRENYLSVLGTFCSGMFSGISLLLEYSKENETNKT